MCVFCVCGQEPTTGKRKRPTRDSRAKLQPWHTARYKYLKPDCDSVRPPYWGTWTKASATVHRRRPFGRCAY